MADDVDLTQEREEKFLRFKLQERKPYGPEPTGYCYNCGDSLPEGHRWCGPECREDWEIRTRRGVK